jgi:hypothetical protein
LPRVHQRPDRLSRWRTAFIEHAPELFQAPRPQSFDETRIAELEHLVGQLTLELAAATNLCRLLRSRSRSGGGS